MFGYKFGDEEYSQFMVKEFMKVDFNSRGVTPLIDVGEIAENKGQNHWLLLWNLDSDP